jgi:hypothetical protein
MTGLTARAWLFMHHFTGSPHLSTERHKHLPDNKAVGWRPNQGEEMDFACGGCAGGRGCGTSFYASAPCPDSTCAAVQIKLSTKSFDAAAAGVAAEAIANCAASLTHADLSDVIAGRPEAEALNSLRILSGALAQVPAMSASLWDELSGRSKAPSRAQQRRESYVMCRPDHRWHACGSTVANIRQLRILFMNAVFHS